MRFLADQDVYAATIRLLRDLGHDVITASDLAMSRAADAQLLVTAQADDRLFVTRDRDFGNLVFVQGQAAGVLYLRMTPATQAAVHLELQNVLNVYSEPELKVAFVVVEAGRHRLRRPRVDPNSPESP